MKYIFTSFREMKFFSLKILKNAFLENTRFKSRPELSTKFKYFSTFSECFISFEIYHQTSIKLNTEIFKFAKLTLVTASSPIYIHSSTPIEYNYF